MSLAQELNELFRFGRTYSYQKFVNGWGRGVTAAKEAFGDFILVRSGSSDEGNRCMKIYRFENKPDELVGLEGFDDSDFSDSLFFDIKAEMDESNTFPIYRKVE